MEADFVMALMGHRSMLHSFVYAIARDAHLTEDILQEVAVVLWQKFPEFKPGTDFGAWARSIAWREVLSARRDEARAHRYLDEACAREILAAYERRDGAVQPASHRLALRTCLEGMGDHVRELIHCRYALKMTSRRLADRFHRSAQAVDALVYRAKKALADCVRARMVGEGEGA